MGTIAEKLTAVANSKAAIASAITGKGGTVPTKFSDYGTAVSSLPNTYTAGDEGKVVSNGALVSQTSLTITENNTYDTTTKSSVTVNVSGGGGGGPFLEVVTRQSSPTWTVSASDLTGATTIGGRAFENCRGLTSISMPNTVTSIGDLAFNSCYGLTSVTISTNLTSIGQYGFGGCTTLTSITIPDSVTTIGNSAFRNCSNLTSITIPNGVTTIADNAFYGCSGLTSVTIGNGVTTIGNSAFYGCRGLTSIAIPDSVTSIVVAAFFGCSSLATIDFGTTRSTIPTLGTSVFTSLPANYQILVPSALLEDWKAANNWNSPAVVDHIVAHQA